MNRRFVSLVNCKERAEKLVLHYGLSLSNVVTSLNSTVGTIHYTVCRTGILYINLRSTVRCLAIMYNHLQRVRIKLQGEFS